MPLVICTWTNHYQNGTLIDWGFGDILRGSINLYNLCKIYKHSFFIDTQHHILHKYLIHYEYPYQDYVKNNKDKIKIFEGTQNGYDNLIKFFENSKDEIKLIHTNGIQSHNVSQDCKIFMQKFLKPNDNLKQFLNDKFSSLPFKNYNIIHFRLGDNELNEKQFKNYYEFEEIFLRYRSNFDIVISDSLFFKKYLKTKYPNIIVFDNQASHFGKNIENNDEDMKNTLLEFYLITSARSIKTYTIYGWTSGFVLWSSKIFSIPLITMKNKNELYDKSTKKIKMFIK